MTNHAARPIAVIIEPRATLADTIAEALGRRGYDVVVVTTHVGGATAALKCHQVDFLVAAVPAPGEDRSGAYLAQARAQNPRMKTVIMLSDPHEDIRGAPRHAVQLVKPFTLGELNLALDQADARHRSP